MLLRLERYQEALMGYDRAIGLRPDYAEAHAGRGAALQYLRRSAEALASCDHAHRPLRRDWRAHISTGGARCGTFCGSTSRCGVLRPLVLCSPRIRRRTAIWAALLLQTGRFDLGWELYEWRSRMPGAPQVHRYPQPRWDGQADLSGKTLFTYLDQGMGDTIQFVRYAKLAEMRGAHVVMAVQDNLRRLMSSLSPTIRVLGQMESPRHLRLSLSARQSSAHVRNDSRHHPRGCALSFGRARQNCPMARAIGDRRLQDRHLLAGEVR